MSLLEKFIGKLCTNQNGRRDWEKKVKGGYLNGFEHFNIMSQTCK